MERERAASSSVPLNLNTVSSFLSSFLQHMTSHVTLSLVAFVELLFISTKERGEREREKRRV